MKKTLFILGTLAFTFSACKKEEGCTDSTATNFNIDAKEDNGTCSYPKTNEEKIEGHWEIDKYYVDNTDGMKQDGISEATYQCDSSSIKYFHSNIVESIEWDFYTNNRYDYLELFKYLTPTSSSCLDGNNRDNYIWVDAAEGFDGHYEINNDGKGELLTLNISSWGIALNARILNLTDSVLDFEYSTGENTFRYLMKR